MMTEQERQAALDGLNKLAMACNPSNETMELVRIIRAALSSLPPPLVVGDDMVPRPLSPPRVPVTEHNFKDVVSRMVMDVVDHMSAFPWLDIDEKAKGHLLTCVKSPAVPVIEGFEMTKIKTWIERCEHHPAHQSGMVTNQMIQDRMQEEINELRAQPQYKRVDLDGMQEMICRRLHSQAYCNENVDNEWMDFENDANEIIHDIKSKYGELYAIERT